MASNDEPLVSVAYSRYRRDMLAMGIQIYEISPQVIRQQTGLEQAFGKATGRAFNTLAFPEQAKAYGWGKP